MPSPRKELLQKIEEENSIEPIHEWQERSNTKIHHDPSTSINNYDYSQNYRSMLLVLLSTFLHLMNIYVIKPTSTEYVMELGENRALTGAIIGTMTGASVLSAFLFSFWTNITYLLPMIMSSSLMILGNLLYASAYKVNSFSLMIIGCALTGLGGPCVINRRFVSETTPEHLRTAATVFLAATSCIGAATGPLVDMVFHNTGNFKIHIFSFGWVDMNELNGPGYFMALLWTVYTCIASIIFKEPKRYYNSVTSSSYSEFNLTIPQTSSSVQLLHNYSIPQIFSNFVRLFSVSDDEKLTKSIITTANEDDCMVQLSNNNHEDVYDDDDNDRNTLLFKQDDDNSMNNNNPKKVFLPQNTTLLSTLSQISYSAKICLLLTFLTMLSSEIVQSSTPIIGYTRYKWDIDKIITLNFINLIIVVPVSVLIVWISQAVNDRDIVLILYPVSLVGLFLLIDISDLIQVRISAIPYHNFGFVWLVVDPARYIIGNIIVYSSLQACSGILASSLSKVISPRFAKGTYNASFLTTVAGSIGKTFGNLLIMAAGYIDMRNLLNLLFIPCFFLVLIIILICVRVKFHRIGIRNGI